MELFENSVCILLAVLTSYSFNKFAHLSSFSFPHMISIVKPKKKKMKKKITTYDACMR